jgi:hypothetical protein
MVTAVLEAKPLADIHMGETIFMTFSKFPKHASREPRAARGAATQRRRYP